MPTGAGGAPAAASTEPAATSASAAAAYRTGPQRSTYHCGRSAGKTTRLNRNPATLAKPPRLEDEEIEPEWTLLLARAGLRDGRLHDARHTAATVLLILEVAERAVMGIMGWSDSGMARRHQHRTAQVGGDIAARVGGLLWRPAEGSNDDPDDGAGGVLAKVS